MEVREMVPRRIQPGENDQIQEPKDDVQGDKSVRWCENSIAIAAIVELSCVYAGVAIMFYGYDQGVMSQVNLNPHYQKLMKISPIEGKLSRVRGNGYHAI